MDKPYQYESYFPSQSLRFCLDKTLVTKLSIQMQNYWQLNMPHVNCLKCLTYKTILQEPMLESSLV